MSVWRPTGLPRLPAYQHDEGSVAAWFRACEILFEEDESVQVASYNKAAFELQLQEIRGSLLCETDPQEFLPKLKEMLAESGVGLVFYPTPRGCPLFGATEWIDGNRFLILQSVRYLSHDSLWFTFFHEAGHILLHEKKLREAGSWFEIDKTESQEEKEADDFARDRLLPSGQDKRLRSLRSRRKKSTHLPRAITFTLGSLSGACSMRG